MSRDPHAFFLFYCSLEIIPFFVILDSSADSPNAWGGQIRRSSSIFCAPNTGRAMEYYLNHGKEGESMMKKTMILQLVAISLLCTATYTFAASGEELFAANCKVCHPDGGNIINPAKTLHLKDRMANNVKTEADIVKRMRDPGPGMTKFDVKTISDKDAQAIAAYILKTFNK
jgi:cytochrome c6